MAGQPKHPVTPALRRFQHSVDAVKKRRVAADAYRTGEGDRVLDEAASLLTAYLSRLDAGATANREPRGSTAQT